MAELDDRYSEYRDEAEKRASSAVTSVTSVVAKYRKAITAFVTVTVIPTVALWLGADAPLVVALTTLATSLGVFAVPNAVNPGQGDPVPPAAR